MDRGHHQQPEEVGEARQRDKEEAGEVVKPKGYSVTTFNNIVILITLLL